LIVTISLLAGCASIQPGVETTTTIFYSGQYQQRGTIAVSSINATTDNSLEFRAYKTRIEAQLAAVGYTITERANHPDFVALVSYGIDNGTTSQTSAPIYGQTGGGTTYSSGSVYGSGGSGSYQGSTYTMPTYGIIANSTRTDTTYNRAIAIDIVEASSLQSENPQKQYEMRAKSSGSCGVFGEVFDEMLQAMFKDFPGKNGKGRTVSVKGVYDC
jgi:Domain of unknown function (DUF4136)